MIAFAWATPHVVILQDSYDYGYVLEGQTVEHSFLLQNRGTTDLLIDKVDTGCGCILSSYPTKISPGFEAPIKIQLITIGYGNSSLNRTIQVYTNDPNQRITLFQINGHVDQFAKISERKIFLTGTSDKNLEKTIYIQPTQKYPFKIIGIQTAKKNIIEVFLNEKKDRNDRLLYEVALKNIKTTPGIHTDEIYLLTNHEIQKGISINVIVKITEK